MPMGELHGQIYAIVQRVIQRKFMLKEPYLKIHVCSELVRKGHKHNLVSKLSSIMQQ